MSEAAPQPPTKRTSTGKTCLVIVLVIIGLLILGTAISSIGRDLGVVATGTPAPTSLPQHNAWYACTQFIDQQLDVSFLDAQDYNPSGITLVAENEYEVQVFYAKYTSLYRCRLLHLVEAEQWQLLSLDLMR